jgi:hypothetical protein
MEIEKIKGGVDDLPTPTRCLLNDVAEHLKFRDQRQIIFGSIEDVCKQLFVFVFDSADNALNRGDIIFATIRCHFSGRPNGLDRVKQLLSALSAIDDFDDHFDVIIFCSVHNELLSGF